MPANVNDNVTLFRWKIVDMCKQIDDTNSKDLTGNTFSLQNRQSVQFQMFIRYGHSIRYQNDVRVILKQLDDKPLKANVKFWIENATSQKFNETSVEKHVFSKVDDFYGYKQFNDNGYDNFRILYRNHETFYICCEIVDLNASIISTINYDQEFHQDQWKLYEEEFHDAIVKVDDGKEFKVLKSFFAAHSKVFKQMFTLNLKEGIKSEINIKDVDENTMKHLIKWMYTNKFEENAPIEKLFAVADKYDIDLLKEICVQQMLSTFNGENAFQRLIIASLHNDSQLKEASLNCISDLKNSQLVNFLTSSEWHNFYAKNNDVAREVGKLVRNKLHKQV